MIDDPTAQGHENPYEHRVERTFGFIDLSGFTGFIDAEGDGAAVDVLDHFRAVVRRLAARHGVRIAKWLGDGAMLVGVECESVAEAVVAMEDEFQDGDVQLALRAGLASGPVILFEGDDYIGQAVNLAARLCSMAQPGEVLATKAMLSSLMVNTTATDIGLQQVEGIAEPVDLVRLASRPARVGA